MSDIILCRSVTDNVPKSKWIASLSNGETIFEDAIKDLPPAWERLSLYVIENKLAITNLRAQLGKLEVTLPTKAEAYVQKKKVISTISSTKRFICIGYVQGNLCQIHQVSEDGDSVSSIQSDPGHPFTIYPHNKGTCSRSCCTGIINEGFIFENDGKSFIVKRRSGDDLFISPIVNGRAKKGKPRRINLQEVLGSYEKKNNQ